MELRPNDSVVPPEELMNDVRAKTMTERIRVMLVVYVADGEGFYQLQN